MLGSYARASGSKKQRGWVYNGILCTVGALSWFFNVGGYVAPVLSSQAWLSMLNWACNNMLWEEKMEETQQLLEQQLAETKASRSQLREELRRPFEHAFWHAWHWAYTVSSLCQFNSYSSASRNFASLSCAWLPLVLVLVLAYCKTPFLAQIYHNYIVISYVLSNKNE